MEVNRFQKAVRWKSQNSKVSLSPAEGEITCFLSERVSVKATKGMGNAEGGKIKRGEVKEKRKRAGYQGCIQPRIRLGRGKRQQNKKPPPKTKKKKKNETAEWGVYQEGVWKFETYAKEVFQAILSGYVIPRKREGRGNLKMTRVGKTQNFIKGDWK